MRLAILATIILAATAAHAAGAGADRLAPAAVREPAALTIGVGAALAASAERRPGASLTQEGGADHPAAAAAAAAAGGAPETPAPHRRLAKSGQRGG